MAVTIITKNVVHSFTIDNVGLFNSFIIFWWGHIIKLQRDVFVCLANSKIINWYVIWPSKIVSHTFWISYTGVTNARNHLCQSWKRSPDNAEWKPCFICSDSIFLIFSIDRLFICICLVIAGSLSRKFVFLFLIDMLIFCCWSYFCLICFCKINIASFLLLVFIWWVRITILVFHWLRNNLHRFSSGRIWWSTYLLHDIHVFM